MTDRHLVTAAHCLAGVESSLYTRVDILMADYNTGDSFTGVRRKMARVLIHPDFNEETLQNDIAVITLRMSVNISPGETPWVVVMGGLQDFSVSPSPLRTNLGFKLG